MEDIYGRYLIGIEKCLLEKYCPYCAKFIQKNMGRYKQCLTKLF